MVRISSSQLDVIILLSLPIVFLILFFSFNVRRTKHIRATRRCVNIFGVSFSVADPDHSYTDPDPAVHFDMIRI
jgi:hypothetical protein